METSGIWTLVHLWFPTICKGKQWSKVLFFVLISKTLSKVQETTGYKAKDTLMKTLNSSRLKTRKAPPLSSWTFLLNFRQISHFILWQISLKTLRTYLQSNPCQKQAKLCLNSKESQKRISFVISTEDWQLSNTVLTSREANATSRCALNSSRFDVNCQSFGEHLLELSALWNFPPINAQFKVPPSVNCR